MKWIWLAPLMLLGLLLAVVTVILLLRIGVSIQYDGHAVQIRARAGFLRILVYPRPDKKPRRRRKKKSTPDTNTETEPVKQTEATGDPEAPPKAHVKAEDDTKQGAVKRKALSPKNKAAEPKTTLSVELICAYARFALHAGGRVLRGLRVDMLRLYAGIGGRDASAVALSYGGAAAAVSSLLPLMESVLRIKKKDIFVEALFDRDTAEVTGEIEITAVVGRLALIALSIYREYLKLNDKKAVGK